MDRAQRRLCWLLAGVIVLVALAIWQWRAEHADDTLLDVAPETVTRIDITWAGQPTRHYIKQGRRWHRKHAASRPADNAHLDTMAALAATPVLQWRDAADVDLTRIGLAKPTVVVRINGHTLAYGALAAFGPQRFVRVGKRIAVVPASYSPRPPSPAPSSASSSQKS
ncbi:MAG TPA: hypothetical protein VFJ15_06145 [Oleiagrimonas sp.]|nr:hypothetical protein [Oleiagrimonas sp.]